MKPAAAALAATLCLAAAPAALAQSPHGVWLTEDQGAHIEFAPCGERLCGRIIWLKDAVDKNGQPHRDDHNPDRSLRQRTIQGSVIIRDLKRRNDREWANGSVYNPDDGRTYGFEIHLQSDGRLKVRGYFGIPLLGGSQYWRRVR